MQSDTVIQWPGPVNCRAAPHSAQVTGRDSDAASTNSVSVYAIRSRLPRCRACSVIYHVCSRSVLGAPGVLPMNGLDAVRFFMCGRLLRHSAGG